MGWLDPFSCIDKRELEKQLKASGNSSSLQVVAASLASLSLHPGASRSSIIYSCLLTTMLTRPQVEVNPSIDEPGAREPIRAGCSLVRCSLGESLLCRQSLDGRPDLEVIMLGGSILSVSWQTAIAPTPLATLGKAVKHLVCIYRG